MPYENMIINSNSLFVVIEWYIQSRIIFNSYSYTRNKYIIFPQNNQGSLYSENVVFLVKYFLILPLYSCNKLLKQF